MVPFLMIFWLFLPMASFRSLVNPALSCTGNKYSDGGRAHQDPISPILDFSVLVQVVVISRIVFISVLAVSLHQSCSCLASYFPAISRIFVPGSLFRSRLVAPSSRFFGYKLFRLLNLNENGTKS